MGWDSDRQWRVAPEERRRPMAPRCIRERCEQVFFRTGYPDVVEEKRVGKDGRIWLQGECPVGQVGNRHILQIQEVVALALRPVGSIGPLEGEGCVSLHDADAVDHPLVAVHDHAVLVSRVHAEYFMTGIGAEETDDRFRASEIVARVQRSCVLFAAEDEHIEKKNAGEDNSRRTRRGTAKDEIQYCCNRTEKHDQ